MKKISLKYRLALPIISLALIILIAGSTYSYLVTKAQMTKEATQNTFEVAKKHSVDLSSSINSLSANLNSLLITTLNMKKLDTGRKDLANIYFKNLKSYPNLVAIWLEAEPGKFDKFAEKYQSTKYGSKIGRYAVYWTKDKSGKYTYHPVSDFKEIKDQGYYKSVKKEQDSLLIPPYIEYVGEEKRPVLMTSIAIPVKEENKFLGVMGYDFALDDLQKIVNKISPFKDSYATLLTIDGKILSHPNKKLLSKNVDKKMFTDKKIFSRFKELKSFKIEDGKRTQVFVPVQFKGVKTKWYLSINLPTSELYKGASLVLKNQIVTMLLVVVLLSFFTYFISNRLSNALNRISQKIQEGATTIDDESNIVKNASNNLNTSTSSQAEAVQQTSSALVQVKAMVEKNSQNSNESSAFVKNCNSVVKNGRDNINDMIHSIEQISNNNDQVSNQVSKNNEEISRITSILNEINDKTKIINDIVFQTKLLSFNASVEAARAGEQGKGFAVVAEEIGNLANVSGKASNEISELLESSQKNVEGIIENSKASIEKIVHDANNVIKVGQDKAKSCNEVFVNIQSQMEKIDQMMFQVANASTEQSQAIDEITSAMQQIDQTTSTNVTLASSTSNSSTSLKDKADSLNKIVTDLDRIIKGAA